MSARLHRRPAHRPAAHRSAASRSAHRPAGPRPRRCPRRSARDRPVVSPQAVSPSSGTASTITIRFNQPSIGYRLLSYGAVCDALRLNRDDFREDGTDDPPVREFPRAVLRAVLCRPATGAFTEAGVEVELVALAQPAGCGQGAARRRGRRHVGRAAAGDDDARQRSPVRSRLLLRRRGARSLLHHRPRSRGPISASPTSQGLRFATVSEVPTPWICLADDIRRAGVDPVALSASPTARWRRTRPRCVPAARCHPCVPALCRAADRLRRGPSLVRRGDARPHRLHHARHPPRRARAAARGAAEDDPRRPSHAGLVRDARRRRRSQNNCSDYFPDVAPADLRRRIERYRALGLWGSDPVIRREGYDRLHAAMRAAGTLRQDSPSTTASIQSSPEQAIGLT